MSRLGIHILVLLLAVGLAPCGCGGGGGGGDGGGGGGGGPPVVGPTTTLPSVPLGTTPPIGVTWRVGITENVSQAEKEALYASFVSTNNALWNTSEGQVRLHEIIITDNVAPGVTASQFMVNPSLVDASEIDIVAWPPVLWDAPFGGAVSDEAMGLGRTGRLMIIPMDAPTFVVLHEGSHFLFHLSWAVGPVLVDEYVDGIQDPACIMEAEWTPWRWCSDANHVDQSSQPHSCWHQILTDYPAFTHSGSDTAPELPPLPLVVYQ